ncbi:hypothetical protein BJY01DRAFT_260680 [Aspergillus pseudoustus]|uniref:FAD-binding domain-containing protein n=1 Tax=Aspergillus pseudoustus TaxID=1810923 RepID=A0ABR4IT75_9EURO
MGLPKVPPIAIIGAGPSGLLLARLLELDHIDYVVFERDDSATWNDDERPSSSGTLDIHKGSGQAALKEGGLLGEFQSIARYDVPTRICDSQGNVCVEFSENDKPEVDRADLRKLLLASIPAARVRWGCKIERVERNLDGTVSIYRSDGQVESGFRLVVGADGAWSKVRNLVTTARPQYSGTHFFTTLIKTHNAIYTSVATMVENGNYLALEKGRQIFLHYLADGSHHLSVGVKLPETWSAKPTTAGTHNSLSLWQSVLQSEFCEWDEKPAGLVIKCCSSDQPFRSWPLYTLSADAVPWESCSGVTLLGDAAHLTIPSGDGVNNALQDSVELARQIVKHGVNGLDSAVREYEETMFPRAAKAIEKGQWYLEHFFGADTPETFLQAVGTHDDT